MLQIKGLSKSYGKEVVLQNMDLEIEENKIYGLLGRNGVGKTTMLSLICGHLIRNSGEILFNGEEVFENEKAIENICLIKKFPTSVGEKKVRDIFKAASILFKNWDEEYKNKLVSEFKVKEKKKLNKLSTGNQTLVGLIIGLASRAKITMFDEPTLGLDAAIRYRFYELVLEDYETHPRTVIISTHLIDEISNLFEEVIIMDKGKILMKDEVSALEQRSYYLTGPKESVDEVIEGKKVINTKMLGNMKMAGIYGELTDKELENIKNKNIQITNIPLQMLFVFLTENNIEEVLSNGVQ